MNRKINNNSTATIAQLLEFEVAFPDEKMLPFHEYLVGVNKQMILKAATFLLSIRENSDKYPDNKAFLQMFFRKENREFANNVYATILKVEESGLEISIINVYSSLKLFELC